MKILLFDMDGVLLESVGYHMALQETVYRMAEAMGFTVTHLSTDTIAIFESAGITSEWDEAAICTALLLTTAWKVDPQYNLPKSPTDRFHFTNPPGKPDFQVMAESLVSTGMLSMPPLERAEYYFLSKYQFSPAQKETLCELIRTARDPYRSLTHRMFQEFVLGSVKYALIYNQPVNLCTESYILRYDRSNLSSSESWLLKKWMTQADHAAAILTSRPSIAPDGIFCTPEAEMGADLVGLSEIPILGWGGIAWLGSRKNVNPQTFIKPSPVHALAALQVALGRNQAMALSDSVDLVEKGGSDSSWEQLDGAQVSIFEDTPGGIISLKTAQKILKNTGIDIICKYYGIGQNPVKISALQKENATIFRSLITPLSLELE